MAITKVAVSALRCVLAAFKTFQKGIHSSSLGSSLLPLERQEKTLQVSHLPEQLISVSLQPPLQHQRAEINIKNKGVQRELSLSLLFSMWLRKKKSPLKDQS